MGRRGNAAPDRARTTPMQAPPPHAPADPAADRPVTRRRVLDGAGQAALAFSLARPARAAATPRP
jgi:hypothetical protein